MPSTDILQNNTSISKNLIYITNKFSKALILWKKINEDGRPYIESLIPPVISNFNKDTLTHYNINVTEKKTQDENVNIYSQAKSF